MPSPTRHRFPAPTASRRVHILAAALMWSLVGTGLLATGGVWIFHDRSLWSAPLLTIALVAGFLKARLVLDRAAGRIVTRIVSRGDGRCLGGFLSWKTWLLVAAMILLGRLLSLSPLPLPARGVIYCAIGAALLIASRRLWADWRRGTARSP